MSYQVNREGSYPVYRQIARWLESQITRGEWGPGSRIPGENELSTQLSVARGSVRRAIELLIERGMLVRVQGKGTFVAPARIGRHLGGRHLSVSEELTLQGVPFQREIIYQGLAACPAEVARALDLEAGRPVFHVRRRWLVAGSPALVHEDFLEAGRFSALLETNLAEESLIQVLEHRLGVRLTWASHALSVDFADRETAESLSVPLGDPLLYDESIVYDCQNQKVLLGRAWYRADRFRLLATVQRE